MSRGTYTGNSKLNIGVSSPNKLVIAGEPRIYKSFNRGSYFRECYPYLYIYLIY